MVARKRHSGELVDLVWMAELPRVAKVADSTVRLLLMAMAKFVNPTRDHGVYRCWASVATLAHLVAVSERQAQRILTGLWQQHFLDVEQVGLRAGRNRAATPTRYVLTAERWPTRALNGGDPQVATNGNGGDPGDATMMVATPGSDGRDLQGVTNAMVATCGSNGRDPGVTRTRNRTRNSIEPVNEPAAAAADSPPPDSSFEEDDDGDDGRPRCALCGKPYVSILAHQKRCFALADPNEPIERCPTCGMNMRRSIFLKHQCRAQKVAP